MKFFILCICLSIFLTNLSFAGEKTVRIYRQWHLLPKQNTNDVEKSKSLKQYQNQKYIYTHLNNLIKNKKVAAVVSEGCEGEINKSFNKDFNGWTYNSLIARTKLAIYKDILTLVPLKLEAQYKEKLITKCGDNYKLIESHNKAFSDLNGFLGYYLRLSQYQTTNKKKFKLYSDSMLKDVKKKVIDPTAYAKAKAKANLKNVEDYVIKRNSIFIQAIKENLKYNPAVIIGAIHVKDLKKRLEAEQIKVKIIDVEGLPNDSGKLLNKIKAVLK